jgi:hypothetical protein
MDILMLHPLRWLKFFQSPRGSPLGISPPKGGKENNALLEEYSSIRDAAKGLKSSAQTIKKYSNNQELFRDKYYLKISDE